MKKLFSSISYMLGFLAGNMLVEVLGCPEKLSGVIAVVLGGLLIGSLTFAILEAGRDVTLIIVSMVLSIGFGVIVAVFYPPFSIIKELTTGPVFFVLYFTFATLALWVVLELLPKDLKFRKKAPQA